MRKQLLALIFAVSCLLGQSAPVIPAAPASDTDDRDKLKTSFTHFFRPIIGAGFNWRTDDVIDFKVDSTSNRLLTENDSKFRAAGTLGFWVPWSTCGIKWEHWLYEEAIDKKGADNGASPDLPDCYTTGSGFRRWRMRSGFVVNFQLNQGGNSNAFSLGYGFMVRPGVIFQASFTRANGKELSHGFRRAAGAAVKANSADDTFSLWRGRFLSDESSLRNDKDWDGFPLFYGTPAKQVFPGSPIIDSYNGSITFGVSIPLDRILRTAAK